jgi:hypothetical protein
MRKILLKVNFIPRNSRYNPILRHKRRVHVTKSGSNKILLPVQDTLEDTLYASNLINVPLLRRGDLLWVEEEKPNGLPEVGTLSAHLEVEESFRVEVLRTSWCKADLFLLLIVGFDEVLECRAEFSEGDSRVWVLDCGKAYGQKFLVALASKERGWRYEQG